MLSPGAGPADPAVPVCVLQPHLVSFHAPIPPCALLPDVTPARAAVLPRVRYTHPDVVDVQVVGVPDEKYGEQVCACVQLRPGVATPPAADASGAAAAAAAFVDEAVTDSVRSFCRDRISHFKVPRYVVVVPEYPMTVTGKIQKYLLREIVGDLLLGVVAVGEQKK